MAEQERIVEIRFISPEPVLAKVLRQRKPLIIGEAGYYWIVDWVESIGKILRNRDMIAYSVATIFMNIGLYGIIEIVSRLFPEANIIKLLKR